MRGCAALMRSLARRDVKNHKGSVTCRVILRYRPSMNSAVLSTTTNQPALIGVARGREKSRQRLRI